jgi:uncharacterized protein (DUF983 family)
LTAGQGAPPSLLAAGLLCRCPACGQGKLFDGFLTVRRACARCAADLSAADSGDGPAVFIILILGAAIVAAALVVEARYAPAFWLHAAIWPPLILGGALGLLRPFKALLIALQFRHRAGQDIELR